MIDTTTPEQLIRELEKNVTTATAEGWRTLLEENRRAVDAAMAGPDAEVFHRELRPVAADVITLWAYLSARWTPAATLAGMRDLHARCIATHPGMAEWLRGHDALDELAAAAAHGAVPSSPEESFAEAGVRASAEAISTYKAAVCSSIAARPDHPLSRPAGAFMEAAMFGYRIDVTAEFRGEHERLERVRQAAERAAAERAAAERDLEAETQRELQLELRARAVANIDSLAAAERPRIQLLARARARFGRSRLNSVRIDSRIFTTKDLGRCLGDLNLAQLTYYLEALDAQERSS